MKSFAAVIPCDDFSLTCLVSAVARIPLISTFRLHVAADRQNAVT